MGMNSLLLSKFFSKVCLCYLFVISSQSGMTISGLQPWHRKCPNVKNVNFDLHLKNPSQSGMNLTSLLLPDFTFIFHPISRGLYRKLNYAKLGCVSSRGAHNFYFLAKSLKPHAKMPSRQRATAWVWRCVVAQA